MLKSSLLRIFLILFVLLTAFPALTQERNVGITVHTEDAYDGYVLFSPVFDRAVYLMDNDGRLIHQWVIETTTGVLEAHLLENGHLIVIAAPRNEFDVTLIPGESNFNGSIREYTWDNEFVWEIEFIGAETRQHHAIDIMPNGNILAILWDYHSLDDALAMGLDPEIVDLGFKDRPLLLPERIVEIDRSTDELVWQWDSWDHLVQDRDPDLPNYGAIAEHRRRIDINYHSWVFRSGAPPQSPTGVNSWLYINAANYSPTFDQIVLSSRRFDEFWIIDYGLSAEETAGPAGDLLYRWGNPFTYQQGDLIAGRQLFRQHDAQWIGAGLPGEGNILLFNNKHNSGTDKELYSSVMEVKPPRRPDGGYDWERDAEVVWSYAADGFFSGALSGVQRLPNGNTLITEGAPGRLIEVNAAGETVWEFVTSPPDTVNADPSSPDELPRYAFFRVHKYPPDYPGFDGKDMSPGDLLIDRLQPAIQG